MEERLTELTSQLGSEEERTKQLSKMKNKYEAIIAELEEKLRKEQEVGGDDGGDDDDGDGDGDGDDDDDDE